MLRSLAFAYSLFTAEANFYTTAHDPSLHTREKKTRFETPNTGCRNMEILERKRWYI